MSESILSQLERLAKLKEQGLLTEEEILQQKAVILGNNSPTNAQPIQLEETEVEMAIEDIPIPTINTPKKENNVVLLGTLGLVVFTIVCVILGIEKNSTTKSSVVHSELTEDTTVSKPSNPDSGTLTITPAPPISKWSYYDEDDSMNGKEYHASIISDNLLEFDFPYNGGADAVLSVRKQKGKTDIILKISKGQFVSSYSDDGSIRIKFDNKPVRRYSISRASDGSSDVIFIDNAQQVIANMKKATNMTIEAEFYNEGFRRLDFTVKGFRWAH